MDPIPAPVSHTQGTLPGPTIQPRNPIFPYTLYGHTATRSPFHLPLPAVDVLIHCGDLTKRSSAEEYRSTMAAIRQVQAPVKIIIAGNHDLSLHQQFVKDNMNENVSKSQRALAFHAEAKHIVAGSKDVTYLEEGTHEVSLPNGARLRLYTSPWTPSYGGWAFQYEGSHNFSIPAGIDVAVTHGPPLGIQDSASNGDYAGCPMLFNSIQKARPRIHCFGHIHEAWGGYYAHWASPEGTPWQQATGSGRSPGGSHPSYTSGTYNDLHFDYDDSNSDVSMPDAPPRTLEALDQARSRAVETVDSLRLLDKDSDKEMAHKRERYARHSAEGCCRVDVSPEGDAPVERGKQTLFLNAAILDRRYKIAHFPWLVEIDLPIA
ncbi:unnamed protein product [Parascedosporium putredinis]|uniref:Calcineurin-like phosphoesterase domain-containing protein n=1 Tax=Parascedosporium putredinis TaxID=1442378 RepID=A0A9P1H7H2_9PEZI|nr:unnamed protein product [Parascedosporium putredinis]CAI8001411.1 unnamed protein product [Parascedosporium putredinis]